MIARFWHGYTATSDAEAYVRLLQQRIIPDIERAHPCTISLLTRPSPERDEVEFVTICYFENFDEIKSFAGEDYESCVVPVEARALLKHYDDRSQHYEILRAM